MDATTTSSNELNTEQIAENVQKLGKWFHNIDLHGVKTAPDHFLGDYPYVKFQSFASAIPRDLTGKTVLDIGCNAGFYSIEMKKRGAARVLGIDSDEVYLEQARYAAKVLEADIEFRNMSVYDLRHPLLALDILYDTVVKDLLIFQSMQRGSDQVDTVQSDYDFWDMEIFKDPKFPQMYFIEDRYSNDPTNWWIPNRAGMEAMLRSAGFDIIEHPELEVYLCRRGQTLDNQIRAIYPIKK
jgi:tRNA (mo5U34)-methyltransferase